MSYTSAFLLGERNKNRCHVTHVIKRAEFGGLAFRRDMALGLDDVLLVPQFSDVKSRLDVDITTNLTKNLIIDAPICSAAMDTVTEQRLAIALSEKGGAGFLHRFASDDYIINMVKDIKGVGQLVVPSVGIRKDIVKWVGLLLEYGADAISIDIAHGFSSEVLNTIEILKGHFPDSQIIAGNVCTAVATSSLISSGADAVKCGIGGGHACKTRLVTGFGMPSFTALAECASVAKEHDIPLIMDGGIKNSGDIVKSLAAGASVCMMGYLFSRTLEAPGTVQRIDGVPYKSYRGMASVEAQEVFKGGLKKGTAAEGESMLVPIEGTVEQLMDELCGGIRSGLTYCGARNLEELRDRAIFTQITNTSVNESKPFGLSISRNLSSVYHG